MLCVTEYILDFKAEMCNFLQIVILYGSKRKFKLQTKMASIQGPACDEK